MYGSFEISKLLVKLRVHTALPQLTTNSPRDSANVQWQIQNSEIGGRRRQKRRGAEGTGSGEGCPLPKFYAELMHFCAKFLPGYRMHAVIAPPPMNPPLLMSSQRPVIYVQCTRMIITHQRVQNAAAAR